MNDEVPRGGGLPRLRAQWRRVWALEILLVLVSVVGLAALAAMWLDAALDLPETGRVLAPWLVAAGAVAVLALGVRRVKWLSELRVARRVERADDSLGNTLTNAVQLARQNSPTSIHEALRLEAVARGRQAAARVRLWPVLRRGLAACGAGVIVTAGAWALIGLVGGPVLWAVWPRFVDPHGDHPPYSRLQFAVNPGHTAVLYGSQLQVRTAVHGGAVDQLWLVAETRRGAPATRTVMFRSPDRTFFQTLANLRAATEYYVTDGRARSRRFQIAVRLTPQITGVEVTTVFPSYTDQAPRTAKLADEELRVPLETQLKFRVTSNRPLTGGRLEVTPLLGGKKTSVPLERGARADEVVGSFTVTDPAAFALAVRDVDGLESADQPQGRVQVLPDQRPQIVIVEPGRKAVATPEVVIPVRVHARDDYGVTRVMWFRSHNGSLERSLNMPLQMKGGAAAVEGAGAFRLAELGVKPGDLIEFFFEAVDNYPLGPHVTTSRLLSVQIISREQYERILRQQAAQRALFEEYIRLTEWLRRLAERAQSLEKDPRRDQMAELARELREFQEELAKSVQRPELFDLESALRGTLNAQRLPLDQVRQRLEEMSRTGSSTPAELRELARQMKELAGETRHKVGEPVRHLGSVAKLIAKADRFTALAQQQAELVRMLRRFQERGEGLSRVEQMELQELASAQRRIEADLRDWLAAVKELQAQVPDEPQYDPLFAQVTDFLEAVAELKIPQDLGEASRLLSDLNGPGGFPPAQRAAQHMDSLLAKCRPLPGTGQQCLKFQPTLREAMGNSLEQILAALGAGGEGMDGMDGYSLFSEDVSLYGPNMELAGTPAGDGGSQPGAAAQAEQLAGNANDPHLALPEARTRIQLQPDAKFPLRYRELVGEYFRAIATTPPEGGRWNDTDRETR